MSPELPGSDSGLPPQVESAPASALPRRKSRFRRALAWFIGLVAGLIVLLVAVFMFKDNIVKWIAERNIHHKTGLAVKIGGLKVGFGTGTLAVKDFKIYNTPEFGGAALISIPELYLELDAEQAADSKLHFKELRFHLAEVNVVKNKEGRLNLDSIKETLDANAPPGGDSASLRFKFAGIDKLSLNLGRILLTDMQQPANNYELALGGEQAEITSLKTEEDLNAWAAAFLIRLSVQEYFKAKEKGQGLQILLDTFRKKAPLSAPVKSSP